MKKLSFWALMNPWKSQSLLVLCHLLLAGLAIYMGVLLFANDVIVPKPFFYGGEILFFILLIAYPIRRARYKFWKTNFVRQKVMDVGMVFSYLLIVVTLANTDAHLAWNDTSDAPFVQQIAAKENVKPAVAAEAQAPVLSRKALRQQFKSFVKSMKAKSDTSASNAGGIALTIFFMILLMIIVAALACGVGCSGNGTTATLLLIGGWALVITLGVYLIRQSKGKRKANYQPTPPKEGEKL
jgi:tetrahydromethanopterin S-methyltransferase subunit F